MQSITAQSRSGVLIIEKDGKEYRLCFTKGAFSAASDNAGGALFRSLCWLRILHPDQLNSFFSGDPTEIPNEDLAEMLLSQNIVIMDAVLDGIDSFIEESLGDALTWVNPQMQFIPEGDLQEWEQYQQQAGTSLPANSVLMEGLRRQDELARYAHLEWSDSDLRMTENMSEDIEQSIEPTIRELWDAWQENHSIQENLQSFRIPPWHGQRAIAILQHQGLLRPATAAELIVFAGNIDTHGNKQHKESLLRKAVELGAGNAHIFLNLAELSTARQDTTQASQDYLAAAQLLEIQSPDKAIAILHDVLALDTHTTEALQELVHLHRTSENTSELAKSLLLTAQCFLTNGNIIDALSAAHEAQQLGANTLTCEQILAECSIQQYDKEQSLLHLGLAAKTALEMGKHEVHISTLQQMLGIAPGHLTAAKSYAEYLFENQQIEAAQAIIDQALLIARDEQHSDEEMVPLRDLLTQVNPQDTVNHDWLARYFQGQEDQVAASAQLIKLANVQEKDEDFQVLTETLDRILELAGAQVPLLLNQARLQARLGLDRKSVGNWDSAIGKLTKQEKLDEAHDLCVEALDLFPAYYQLHIRQADIFDQQGNRSQAIHHYRRAVYLAHGAGNLDLARKLIAQLLILQPDDVLMRCQLADIAHEAPHEDDDEVLQSLIRLALKSQNVGLALERSRQRLAASTNPSCEVRCDFIELLRRTGHHQEEKHEGLLLFQSYLEAGSFTDALMLLERLVASSKGQDSYLVQQLAELYEGLDKKRQAIRYYRHAVTLFQQEENPQEAHEALAQLTRLTDNAADIRIAQQLLNDQQAINWASIAKELKAKASSTQSSIRTKAISARMPSQK